jgi:DNA-binding HxlR family transcriptional regulator
LFTLYDLFREHPLAEVELSQLETSCRITTKALNWNLVYLEKKGFVSLSASADCLHYAACTASITGSGIDLVEHGQDLSRQFPLETS